MKLSKLSFISIFIFLAACIIIVSCSKSDPSPRITINKPGDRQEIAIGATAELDVDIKSDKNNISEYSYSAHAKGTPNNPIISDNNIKTPTGTGKTYKITGSMTVPTILVLPGEYELVVKAKDSAGHEATATRSFIIKPKAN